jgi:conjugative relaxase-like TrwC/TraI family protein
MEQAERYLKSSKEEYYANENAESFFGGKANELAGDEVSKETFHNFLSKNKVATINLTFSNSKSFSILTELTQDKELQEKLIEIHDQAMAKTMQYVEENIIQTRLFFTNEAGKREYEQVKTGKIEYAAFRHHSSRENDPQLHTHVTIANRVKVNGKDYSIDARNIYKEHIKIGKMYRAELINELRHANIEVKITDYKNFFFEIPGVDQSTIEQFSKQSKKMKEVYEELKAQMPNEPDAKLKEMANLECRAKKDKTKTVDDLREDWQKESIQKDIKPQFKEIKVADNKNIQNAIKEAGEKLNENISYFSDIEFRNEIRQQLIYENLKFSDKDVNNNLQELVKSKDIIKISNDLYTTKEIRIAEKEIEKYANTSHNKFSGIFESEEAIKEIAAWENKEGNFKLTEGQRKTLEAALTSKDGMMIFQGDAGTGKTAVLKALKEITENKGVELEGLSTTGKAADEIVSASNIKSRTIDSFLLSKQQDDNLNININKINMPVQKSITVPENDIKKKIYVVDESSMNATLKIRDVIRQAEKEGAQVILQGDTKQLASIQAGGMFERLQKDKNITFSEMKESIRQKDKNLKTAVKTIADGKVLQGIKMLDGQNKIFEIKDKDVLYKTITDAYIKENNKDNFILSAQNKDRFVINQIVREKLKENNSIAKDDNKIIIREGKSIGNYAKKQVWNYDEKDLIVKGTHAYEVKKIDIENKTITAFDREKNKEIVMQANIKNEVYLEQQKDFSNGDKIVFLKNTNSDDLKVKNGQTAIINNIEKLENDNYKINAKMNNKIISFETNDYNYFTHAYCITSYKSQGQTAEKVWIYSDKTTANETYVNVSRAKLNAEIYTMNKATLFKTAETENKQMDSMSKEKFEIMRDLRIDRVLKEQTNINKEDKHIDKIINKDKSKDIKINKDKNIIKDISLLL